MSPPLSRPACDLLALVSIAVISACASSGETRSPGADTAWHKGASVNRICAVSSIRGFQSHADQSLIVSVSSSRRYLIETIGICSDLDFSLRIGLETFTGCLSRGDRILVAPLFEPHRRRHMPLPSCRVNRIYEWLPEVGPQPESTEEQPAER